MITISFLHDGYTRPGYIQVQERLHGPLRFTFRPALVSERSQLAAAAIGMPAVAFDQHVAEFLAGKVLSWDLRDECQGNVKLSADNVLRLHPELFVKLYTIVVGSVASDLDPEWTEEQRDECLSEVAKAQASGRTVGEVREECDEKN